MAMTFLVVLRQRDRKLGGSYPANVSGGKVRRTLATGAATLMGLTFKGFVAKAVVTASFLNPPQPTIAVLFLVLSVLIETGIKSGRAWGFLCILGIHALGKQRA